MMTDKLTPEQIVREARALNDYLNKEGNLGIDHWLESKGFSRKDEQKILHIRGFMVQLEHGLIKVG